MYATVTAAPLPKPELYGQLLGQLRGLFSGERNALANTANFAALLYQCLPDLNWAGFYFMRDGGLILGPFQGKVACVRIAVGQGVCGTAAALRTTQIVRDVHKFPGHIACDAASNSEIVVPLLLGGRVLGVLDLDSPRVGRFDGDDAQGLEQAAALLLEASDMDAYF